MNVVVYWRKGWLRQNAAERRDIQRRVLARHLELSHAEIRISTSQNGKPFLTGPDQQGIHYSVSHSDDLWAMAISSGQSIGLDIEKKRSRRHLRRLARRILGSEVWPFWLALGEVQRLDLFYQAWSLKEACVKAADGRLFQLISDIGWVDWRENSPLTRAALLSSSPQIIANTIDHWPEYSAALASSANIDDISFTKIGS